LAAGWDETELVTLAMSGDCEAFAALCERYRTRVWRIVASFARGPDAEDLAQEAILKALSSIRSYRQEAPFGAWMCKIALNVAHDYRRSAWKRRVTPQAILPECIDTGSPRPDRSAEQHDTALHVRREVANLPASLRNVVWLHYFEEFTLAEVAALERIPESTVRSRLRSGLQRLSLALSDLLELTEPNIGRTSRCGV
jgi:RNA polymerase sigma-70 factor (ECF subfamily)